MASNNPSKKFCFVCIKTFQSAKNKNDGYFHYEKEKFFSFVHQYLEISALVTMTGNGIDGGGAVRDAVKVEGDRDQMRRSEVFCGSCLKLVKGICELYDQLCAAELGLSCKLGELGKLMKMKREGIVRETMQIKKLLAKQLGFKNGKEVEETRSLIMEKCIQKYEDLMEEAEEARNENEEEHDVKEMEVVEIDRDDDGDGNSSSSGDNDNEHSGQNASLNIPEKLQEDSDCEVVENYGDGDDDIQSVHNSEASKTVEDEENRILAGEDEDLEDNEGDGDQGSNSDSQLSVVEEGDSDSDFQPESELEFSDEEEIAENPQQKSSPPQDFSRKDPLLHPDRTCTCSQCGKGYKTVSHLLIHLYKHEKDSKEKSYPCCFCPKSFAFEQSSKLHFEIHHKTLLTPSPPFSCDFQQCTQHFQSASDLLAHLKKHSQSQSQSESEFVPGSPIEIQTCSSCDWSFSSPILLKLHEILHTAKDDDGRFPCSDPDCTSRYPSSKHLQAHYNARHGAQIGSFKCPKCDLSLASETGLKRHIKKHENIQDPENEKISEVTWCLAPAPCSECGMQFLHQHVLDNHMKSVHNLGVQCPICEKRVSGRSSLGTHMARMHKHKVNGILHPCPHCGNLYGPIYLKEHIALCHPEFVDGKGTHECPHCQGRFHRKPVFLKHLRSCSKNPERSRQRRRRRLINPERDESGRFICEICGKSCATKLTLTNHIDGVHKKEEMKWRRNHICHVCGKVLSNKGNFNIHQEIHKGKKRRLFPCHLCSVTYTQKSHVLSHLINVHGKKKGEELTPGEGTPPKRHRCLYPACELKFAEEQQLQNHVEQSHTVSENEEKFMCNACGRVFQNNGALARHSFSHSGEKPHKCEHCTSSGHPGFTRKSSLMEHLMAVHGEGKEQQYFPCEQPGCSAKFTCPPYLQAHMRSVHKIKKK